LHNIFLITPQTPPDRIKEIDQASRAFIYMVAAYAITGARKGFEAYQEEYFQRIAQMKLNNPRLIGFGISGRDSFRKACRYANGAIIGSAFIKALNNEGSIEEKVRDFVKKLK
jgi:tryptophan synthase alpha chain